MVNINILNMKRKKQYSSPAVTMVVVETDRPLMTTSYKKVNPTEDFIDGGDGGSGGFEDY